MRIFLSILLYLLAAVLTGCTHNISRDDFQQPQQFADEFNRKTEEKTSEIVFKNNNAVELENARVEDDSIKGKVVRKLYGDLQMVYIWEKHLSFPVSEVKRASVVYHTKSIFTGMAIGIVSGAALGLVFLRSHSGSSISGAHTDNDANAYIGTILGILPGAILGGIIGEDYIYNFESGKPGYDRLNSSQRYGFRLSYHPGFNSRILGDGYPDRFNRIKSSSRPGAALTFYYNQPISRIFSLNNEASIIYAGSEDESIIRMPGSKGPYGYYTEIPIIRKSTENIALFELAVILRLSIKRTEISPYLLIGPRLDFLFPVLSDKEKFYEDINNQYQSQNVNISGRYNRILFGGAIGGGISTGKLLPAEILIEARYNFDISSRFNIHYDTPLCQNYWSNYGAKDISLFSREWFFSLGFALPDL